MAPSCYSGSRCCFTIFALQDDYNSSTVGGEIGLYSSVASIRWLNQAIKKALLTDAVLPLCSAFHQPQGRMKYASVEGNVPYLCPSWWQIYSPLDYLQSIWAVMMWPVLFKLQRFSHTDDAAAVRRLKNKHSRNAGGKKSLFAANVRLHGMIKGPEAGICPGTKIPFTPSLRLRVSNQWMCTFLDWSGCRQPSPTVGTKNKLRIYTTFKHLIPLIMHLFKPERGDISLKHSRTFS